jgi:hypothetical protein
MKIAKTTAYIAFSLSLAVACYLRPVPDDFDRYVYEALIRSPRQPVQDIYQIVKHESPRVEASSVLDSPEHLAQLEPLYAIRPLYVEAISIFSHRLAPQKSITFISVLSLFLLAALLLIWTRRPVYSALLLLTPAVLTLGRMGTPDAFSTLFVVAGFWLLTKNLIPPAIFILLISVWIRTDNVLAVVAVLMWLAWTRRLSPLRAGGLIALAVASVLFINHNAGNYGYLVLFRYSFIAGKYPAEILPTLTMSEYLHAFGVGAESTLPQTAPWVLLGVVAWRWLPSARGLLVTTAAAAAVHFALFPSPEARYLVWAYLLCGIMFVVGASTRSRMLPTEMNVEPKPLAA